MRFSQERQDRHHGTWGSLLPRLAPGPRGRWAAVTAVEEEIGCVQCVVLEGEERGGPSGRRARGGWLGSARCCREGAFPREMAGQGVSGTVAHQLQGLRLRVLHSWGHLHSRVHGGDNQHQKRRDGPRCAPHVGSCRKSQTP